MISHVMVSPGDTLHVFDAANLRHTVLSPDYRTVRTSPVPGRVYDAFHVSGGATLVQAPARTPERFGQPLHLIGQGGEIVRSFGSHPRTFPADGTGAGSDVDAEFRPVAQASPTTTWVGQVGRHEFGLWDIEGRLIRTLVTNNGWFQPWKDGRLGDPLVERPKPSIRDLHQDAGGLLWVVIGVADRRWKRVDDRPRGERRPLPISEIERRFDVVLEVIDPTTGQLLASARDDGPSLRFFAGNLALRPGEDEDGNSYVDVVRVHLVDPGARGRDDPPLER